LENEKERRLNAAIINGTDSDAWLTNIYNKKL
jgi:hypothetical protein